MYITINGIIGENTIDLSYPISSNKAAMEALGPHSTEGPHWPLGPTGVALLYGQRSTEIAVITHVK